jgi:hypothetical protein
VEEHYRNDCAFISAKVRAADGATEEEKSFILHRIGAHDAQYGDGWVLPQELLEFMESAAARMVADEAQRRGGANGGVNIDSPLDEEAAAVMVGLRVCRLLLDALSLLESKFVTTLEEDEVLLNQWHADPSLPYLQEAALRVRVGEKRILAIARRNVFEHWQTFLEGGKHGP